jgi:dUTP pyrophosphatase
VKPVQIRLKRVGHVEVPLPDYQTAGSVGLDLRAAIEAPLTLQSGERELVPTGIALGIPAGYEGQVRPRSGLSLREGLTVLNSPGTIDSDFRGGIGVVLINLGKRAVTIKPLDRIAQLVVVPVARAELVLVDELDTTARGSGGYGSTGRS